MTGSSCWPIWWWVLVYSKMRDAATQDRRWNERAKLRIFREIAKWRRWRYAPCLTATAGISDLRIVFRRDDTLSTSKTLPATTLMVHRNSPNISRIPSIFTSDYICCSAADGSGSCHAPAPSYFEEITRCRRQKLHWRWPGNANGRSKFRNLGLFTFTRLQLTLRRRLRSWWRLPQIAQTARCRR